MTKTAEKHWISDRNRINERTIHGWQPPQRPQTPTNRHQTRARI